MGGIVTAWMELARKMMLTGFEPKVFQQITRTPFVLVLVLGFCGGRAQGSRACRDAARRSMKKGKSPLLG
jgi:hypothetical protein